MTSCVRENACVLGEVVEGEMVLNEIGLIAQAQWQAVMERYAYVYSHAFVVMPNHVHGLVEINQQWDLGGDIKRDDQERDDQEGVDRACVDQECVRTGRDLSLHDRHASHIKSQEPVKVQKIKSISELMGAYKTTSSKLIRLAGLSDFVWQRSFHDHIVRNEQSFRHIKDYIENNPTRWQEDKFWR